MFNNFLGPTDGLYVDILQPWLKDIETQTEGRVTFQVPEASLAPPPELLTMVQQGIADGGFIMTGFLEGSNPLLQISLLPSVNASAMAGSIAAWRTYETHLSEVETLEGVEVLGLLTLAPGSFYSMSDTVFDDISDLKGVKFWALPGLASRSLGALGAVLSSGPAVRMYEVVSGGVVDAYCCLDFTGLAAFIAAGGKVHAASEEMIAALAEAWASIYQDWIDAADAAGLDGAAALAYYRAQNALIAAGN